MCRNRRKAASDAMPLLSNAKLTENVIQLIFIGDLPCDLAKIMKTATYIKG